MGSPQKNLELSSCHKLKHIHPERLHKVIIFKMWTHIKGNTFTFLFLFGCFLAFALATTSKEEDEIIEDLSNEDLTPMDSVRSSRFLRWPSLPNKKVRIK